MLRWLCLSLLLLLAGGAAPLAAATPYLIKDINSVPAPGSSTPYGYENVLPGLSLFTADDGVTGYELWRTDGTPGGTFRLTDACPGECSSLPAFLGSSDRLSFFSGHRRLRHGALGDGRHDPWHLFPHARRRALI